MLYEIPVIRKRERIFSGHNYVDWCAYCGTVGGRPIRFYSKDKLLVEEKALQYISLSRHSPAHQILKRKEIIDAANAIEYLAANGFGEIPLTQIAYDYIKRTKRLGDNFNKKITIGKALNLFVETLSNLQPRSIQSYNSAINSFLKSISQNILLNDISKHDILKHLSQFTSIITYNSNHSRLRSIFNWFVSEGMLEISPMKQLKPKQVPYREPVYFMPEKVAEIMRVIEENPPEAGGILFFVLGFFCGIRSAEILRLEWRDIDLDAGTIRVRQPKGFSRGVKPRIVELERNALAWVKKYFQHGKQGKIITTRMTEWKKQVLEPLGLSWGNDSNHNVMRHTYATMHVGFFRNASATALNLGHGHSSTVLERYYMGVVTRDVASKYWEIRPLTT